MPDSPGSDRPPGAGQAVLLAHEAAQGTLAQILLDLSKISGRVSDGPAAWPTLARQLDSLGVEISQAAGWLREAATQGATVVTLDEDARRVRMVYPALTAEEARQVAGLERQYLHWHVWPRVGYPATLGWYARRVGTSPPALIRAAALVEVAPAIESWIKEHAETWRWPGQTSR